MNIHKTIKSQWSMSGFSLYIIFLISCTNNSESLSLNQISNINDSVKIIAESISKDISHDGPAAWLKYFENSPGFFMASDGQLVFQNNDSATNFIKNTLVKSIIKINLKWTDIRIDPLTANLAGMGSNFHEDLTDPMNKITSIDGYFSCVFHRTSQGWLIRNAHWSVLKTQ